MFVVLRDGSGGAGDGSVPPHTGIEPRLRYGAALDGFAADLSAAGGRSGLQARPGA